MPFVNEFISQENIEKYDIKKIDKNFVVGGTRSDQWTIDAERNIYLRRVSRGREEFWNQSEWTLFWQGELIVIELHLIDGGGKRGEPGWAHWHVHHIQIPKHLEVNRTEILASLKEALTAFKDAGVYSSSTTFSVTVTS